MSLSAAPLAELVSTDPCTGDVLWRGPMAGITDVGAALEAARAAQPAWALLPDDARDTVARRFAALARADREPLAALIARETGKPLWEARTEVDSVAAKVDIAIAVRDARAGSRSSEAAGITSALAHKPHGVLAVLGPYNFPMHLANGHIVPALIAGNAVVFKPSELTPACGLAMVDLWRRAGLPDGLMGVVTGGAETGRLLSSHPDIDGLLFTGSATTGRLLARQFAETPHKMLALEMGGNAPLVVWDVADLDAAAHVIAQSAYLSAGQRCTCARRLILPAGAAGNAVLEALVAVVDRLIVGAPFDEPPPFMGPVIDVQAASRLCAAEDALMARGGRAIRRLALPGRPLPFLAPALIDVTHVADRPDEEHFGPLLQVVHVTDFAAALDEANATRFGLAAGLISDDEALWRRFWATSRAGVVNWNRPTTGASSALPFGGVGDSGNHRPSAAYAADYCAWPVASLTQPVAQAPITTGLRP